MHRSTHRLAAAAVTRAITMANPVSEKTIRGSRKANLTKDNGAPKRYMAEQYNTGVLTQLDKLKVGCLFNIFEEAHATHHRTLADESDIQTSAEYYSSADGTYIEEESNAHKWLSPIVPVPTSHEPVFNSQTTTGDSLTYKKSMVIFDEVVDSKPVDGHMKLTRVLQFTSGDAKNAIRHCALIGGSRGYEQGRHILSSRFGNESVISHSIIDNLKICMPVSSAAELQQLADDLTVGIETVIELNMSSEIDSQCCNISCSVAHNPSGGIGTNAKRRHLS